MLNEPTILGIPSDRWGAPEDSVRQALARQSFISLRYRFVYVETPKVACTSIKTFIHRLEGLSPMPPIGPMETRRSMAIHNRAAFALPSLFWSIAPAEAVQALADPGFFRFAFVRNPYARLYSAWRDKVHLVEPAYERFAQRVRDAFPQEVTGELVPFAPFVRFVCERRARDNVHWAPQTALLFPDAIPYDMIGHIEQFEQDFARFIEHLHRQGAGDLDLTTMHLNRRSDGDWRDLYTPELADMVYARFREDFDRFAYTRESWQADGTLKAGDPMATIRRLEHEIFERNRVIALLNTQPRLRTK